MPASPPGHHVMGSQQNSLDEEYVERGQDNVRVVSVEDDCWPCCIVWTWIPGCTQCTGGVVGHMGIGTSTGQLWEFLGDGASQGPRGGGLAFGPIMRYVQLNPRRVHRGTWDEGIETTIKKWRGTMHGACVSNCHSFVADCLQEMRYGGIPCWTWLPYLLAVWVWVAGRFPNCPRFLLCFLSTACVVGIIIAFAFFGSHAK
mmetsp:Transcript_32658/g.75930  ORF Transcript_32658/g.75930 Transcript_32658/m.75930 type:complete len:201 (-) Transcript_32658:82-684(-)